MVKPQPALQASATTVRREVNFMGCLRLGKLLLPRVVVQGELEFIAIVVPM